MYFGAQQMGSTVLPVLPIVAIDSKIHGFKQDITSHLTSESYDGRLILLDMCFKKCFFIIVAGNSDFITLVKVEYVCAWMIFIAIDVKFVGEVVID